ncbi:MAG: PadR family transcriptional regulator [Promethearchaeota archaeon]
MSIKGTKLTLNDITVLGLLIEEKNGVTGLQLEKTIEQRGMRVWTNIGKSSVYYALKKLQKNRYAHSETISHRKDNLSPPIKEIFYKITEEGEREFEKAIYSVIANPEKIIDPFDIAYAFSGILSYELLTKAFRQRITQIQERKAILKDKIEEFSKPGAYGYQMDGSKIYHETVIQHIVALFTRPLSFVEAEEEWLMDILKTMKANKKK